MLRGIKEAAKEESTMIRGSFVHPHVDGTNALRECHGDITLSDPINDCFPSAAGLRCLVMGCSHTRPNSLLCINWRHSLKWGYQEKRSQK